MGKRSEILEDILKERERQVELVGAAVPVKYVSGVCGHRRVLRGSNPIVPVLGRLQTHSL